LYKSEAHKRKIAELIKQGKLPQKVADEWEKSTSKDSKLPERLPPKPRKKK
jgi:hypothetical protein